MSVGTIAKNIADFATMPLSPTIPARPPWLAKPKRNVCWVLREMRAFYEDNPSRWGSGEFQSGDQYCVVGLAYHIAGNRPLAHETLKYLGRVTSHNGILWGIGREFSIALWNDSSGVWHVIAALHQAEDLAEKARVCE